MDKASILVIDDEEKLRSLLKRIISLEGFRVLEAGDLKTGLKILEKERIDIVLCDVKLPDGNGVDFTKIVKSRFRSIEVIVLTAFGNIRDGVEAMQNGAFNYLTKGDDNARIIPLLNEALEKKQITDELDRSKSIGSAKYSFDSIIGTAPLLKEAIDLAKQVAPNSTTVMLLGETGTGKEVFANAIHQLSKRSAFQFVALNCSSFSKELMESEIFGYKAGAFTNASKDKKGLLEEADKGTIFLDEIGELPLDLQSKLLRVLENGEYIKIGDTKTTRVDLRIITATNRDLKNEVAEGRFREDLFYRLNVYTIPLPALRERKKDILPLAQYFIGFFAQKAGIKPPNMSEAFQEKLQDYEWKGNIRELKNCIERAMVLSNGQELALNNLPVEIRRAVVNNHQMSAFDLSSIEKLHIQRVLIHTHYNKAEAARLLNIGLATLYRKIEEYQLQ